MYLQFLSGKIVSNILEAWEHLDTLEIVSLMFPRVPAFCVSAGSDTALCPLGRQ